MIIKCLKSIINAFHIWHELYVPGLSGKLRHAATKLPLRRENTDNLHFVNTIPRKGTQDTNNSVYIIKSECSRQHIEETKRLLNLRIWEHKKHTQLGLTDKSKITEHICSETHKFMIGKWQKITPGKIYSKQKVIETSYIKLLENPISQISIEIRPSWISLVKTDLRIKDKIFLLSSTSED